MEEDYWSSELLPSGEGCGTSLRAGAALSSAFLSCATLHQAPGLSSETQLGCSPDSTGRGTMAAKREDSCGAACTLAAVQ